MTPKLTPYGLDSLQRGLQQAPATAKAELLAAATEAVMLLESDVVGTFPHHTGVSRASIAGDAFSTPAGVLGLVGSSNPVVAFVELGTKPHTPPIEPLLQWVGDVLGLSGDEAFAAARGIQRKIRARGTPARKVFEQSLVRNLPRISGIFEAAGGRVAAALEKGAR